MPQKVREVTKRLEDEGWYLDRTRGSHRQYKHPEKTGTVTVSGKPGHTIAPPTWGNVQRQAGWEEDRQS